MYLPRVFIFVILGLLCLCTLAHAKIYNAMEHGAKGDGKTDDTAAIQKLMDEASQAGGGVVFLPTGNYLIQSHLRVPNEVTLKGIWEIPTAWTQNRGTTLLAVDGKNDPDGTPFITLMRNATLKGLTIFYPEQVKTAPPIAYPWTVSSGGADNCSIVDVLIVNPYQAVDFGTRVSGRHLIKGLYAQPLYKGIFVDLCYDVGRIEDVHLWPFWDWNEDLKQWMWENSTAFIIAKTDWEYMFNCFTLGYKVGYHFINAGHGPGNALLTTCGADIGPTALLVDDCQGHVGVSFVNSQMYGDIIVSPSNTGPVKFTGSALTGSIDGKRGVSHAKISGSGQISFVNCNFITIDPKNQQQTMIHADGGGLCFTGCDFMDGGKKHIVLDPGVQSALITGNRFRGKMKVINNSKAKVVIANNVDDSPQEEPNAIVVDNSDGKPDFSTEGDWKASGGGIDYLGWQNWAFGDKGNAVATWTPELPHKGIYEVFVWYGLDPHNDHAKNAPYTVDFIGGKSKTVRVDQTDVTEDWVSLGRFKFQKGRNGFVELSNDADGNVVADAVKFLPVKKSWW